MRIGLFSQWYEPEPIMIPSVLARELGNRGHSVRVLTGLPNYPTGRLYQGYRITWRQDSIASGIPVRRVALIPSHNSSIAGRLANYLSFAASASIAGSSFFKDVDALWVANSPPTVGLPTRVIKARYRPRIVLHIMDLWPESLMASSFNGVVKHRWLKRILDQLLSRTYRDADIVACSSRSQIQILAKRGVPLAKLAYVPIWVDEQLFHPTQPDRDLAARLGVSDKVVLLYAGSIGEPQGLDPLIEALSRLRQEPSLHCLVAGSGSAEQRLRKRALELKLTNISFLGRWPMEDIGRLMAIGDVHLVSLRNDPLADVAMPSKVPATLAAGKPVIAAARGEAASLVSRSGAGWVCPPGDVEALVSAILAAAAIGRSGLDTLGRKAREAYEAEFSLAIGVGRIERLCSGVQGDEVQPN